ncbi:MAG: GNAT family N-acetyltransferase [Clostridia bacterium]|nr:GNAT family N-acetyltransferase [Clostridia bacterium]
MIIRRAAKPDIPALHRLLRQVLDVHHQGRPDLFRGGVTKYTNEQLEDLLCDDGRPVFVALDEAGVVQGYAFCVFEQHVSDNILTDIQTLYIDDLCVDAAYRGQHIGKALYEHVRSFAKASGCYNVTLNVWVCNESARKFYEACGLRPQKIGMETIL